MRLRLLGIAALMLCLLSNISFASTPQPDACVPGYVFNPIPATDAGVGLALIALIISFDVIAIAYAISRLFPHLGIRNWLQQEYWEVAKSAIIIVSIYAAITFVGNLSYLIVPSAVTAGGSTGGFADITPLVSGAERYLCGVNSNMTNVWQLIGIIAGGTGFWTSMQVGFYIPVPLGPFLTVFSGISFQPYSNWMLQTGNYLIAPYGSIVNDMVNFLLFPFTALTIGLITLMPSLAYLGITFFIPLGLVMRALPFIRGVGGTVIAIGIALSVVLPAVFVLFNYQVTALVTSAIPIANVQGPSLVGLSCSLPGSGILGTIICTAATPVLDALTSTANLFGSVWYVLDPTGSGGVFGTNAEFFFVDQLMRVSFYVVIQMIIFAVDLMIMYPLVDGIARMMGGSIRLRLGGKLRLAS